MIWRISFKYLAGKGIKEQRSNSIWESFEFFFFFFFFFLEYHPIRRSGSRIHKTLECLCTGAGGLCPAAAASAEEKFGAAFGSWICSADHFWHGWCPSGLVDQGTQYLSRRVPIRVGLDLVIACVHIEFDTQGEKIKG